MRARAAIAEGRGQLRQARDFAQSSLELVRDTGGSVVVQISVSILGTVTCLLGEEEDVLAQYEDYLCRPPEIVSAMVGAWHAECGRLDIARRCYQPAQVNDR
jgi:hypothetical protein